MTKAWLPRVVAEAEEAHMVVARGVAEEEDEAEDRAMEVATMVEEVVAEAISHPPIMEVEEAAETISHPLIRVLEEAVLLMEFASLVESMATSRPSVTRGTLLP